MSVKLSPWKKCTRNVRRSDTKIVFYERHGEGPKGKFRVQVYTSGSITWMATIEVRNAQGHSCGVTLSTDHKTLEEAQQKGTDLLIQRCQEGEPCK